MKFATLSSILILSAVAQASILPIGGVLPRRGLVARQDENDNNGGNNNNDDGNNNDDNNNDDNNNDDGNNVLQLDPNNVQTGSQGTGQEGVITPGQVESNTDDANFINFCTGKTLTNGQQNRGGSCNGIVMGDIPPANRMVSTILLFPQPGDDIEANQDFDIEVFVDNLQAGSFTNAQLTYYSAPQELNNNQQIIGHCHVTVQDLGGSLTPDQPPNPEIFAFFKGINDYGDGNGRLRATVTGGLPPGFYRVCSMNSASNHQPVLMPVAQRGAQDDCTKFTVGQGNNNAGNDAGAGDNDDGAAGNDDGADGAEQGNDGDNTGDDAGNNNDGGADNEETGGNTDNEEDTGNTDNEEDTGNTGGDAGNTGGTDNEETGNTDPEDGEVVASSTSAAAPAATTTAAAGGRTRGGRTRFGRRRGGRRQRQA